MISDPDCPDLCLCDECARLDLDYPGEGRQLALDPQLLQAVDGDRATAWLVAADAAECRP